MKKKEICAVILARVGSRRLPKKNTIDLCGKPMIAYTIRAAKKSKYINRIMCSTDNQAIAAVAKKCGAEIPYIRPRDLATDKAPSLEALMHVLNYLERKNDYHPDIVILLQPTSPLRTAEHIDMAIRLFYSRRPKSLISVVKVKSLNQRIATITNGNLSPIKNEFIAAANDYYRANGAIYIALLDILKESKTFWTDDTIPFIMDEASSVDIDTELDLYLAKAIMLKRYTKNLPVSKNEKN